MFCGLHLNEKKKKREKDNSLCMETQLRLDLE